LQVFADTAQTFRELSSARRDLLNSEGFQTGPFFGRLWYGRLYWVVEFAKIELRSAGTLTARKFIKLYCRTADRLFGGNRFEAYLEARRKEAEECRRKIQEEKTRMQKRAERRVALELTRQRLTNPNFVPPSRDHIN